METLLAEKLIIRTDHQSLKHLLEQNITLALQHKWVSKLPGVDFEIVYKKGVENKAADAGKDLKKLSSI